MLNAVGKCQTDGWAKFYLGYNILKLYTYILIIKFNKISSTLNFPWVHFGFFKSERFKIVLNVSKHCILCKICIRKLMLVFIYFLVIHHKSYWSGNGASIDHYHLCIFYGFRWFPGTNFTPCQEPIWLGLWPPEFNNFFVKLDGQKMNLFHSKLLQI